MAQVLVGLRKQFINNFVFCRMEMILIIIIIIIILITEHEHTYPYLEAATGQLMERRCHQAAPQLATPPVTSTRTGAVQRGVGRTAGIGIEVEGLHH